MKTSLTLCLALFSFGCAETPQPAVSNTTAPTEPAAEDDQERQVEVGLVNWQRNLDEAKALSAKTDKPILLLFQEIPG